MAYESGKNQIYDKDTQTLVISGTHNIQDVITDIKDVPTNNITNTDRYKEALKLFKQYQPKNIIGHSLGGLIANEINNRQNYKGRVSIYNAPLISGISDIKDNVNDYSKYGDLVSILDTTAKRTTGSINPLTAHSYH
jgi:alpha-beta hydrolase superfamily lysophospholipase